MVINHAPSMPLTWHQPTHRVRAWRKLIPADSTVSRAVKDIRVVMADLFTQVHQLPTFNSGEAFALGAALRQLDPYAFASQSIEMIGETAIPVMTIFFQDQEHMLTIHHPQASTPQLRLNNQPVHSSRDFTKKLGL